MCWGRSQSPPEPPSLVEWIGKMLKHTMAYYATMDIAVALFPVW